MAIAPVDASAEPAPIGTVTVRPLTVAVTVGSDCVLPEGPEGLPPHAAEAASARRAAALPQPAQNSRRVGVEISSSVVTISFTLSPHQVVRRRWRSLQQNP